MTQEKFEFIAAYCFGNPGAIHVMKGLEMEHLKVLEKFWIFGFKVWVLYKDCCNMDMGKLTDVLDEANKIGNLRTALENHHVEEKNIKQLCGGRI